MTGRAELALDVSTRFERFAEWLRSQQAESPLGVGSRVQREGGIMAT